jgi:hypothetical protein
MSCNNGRVDITEPSTNSLFKIYDKIPAKQCNSLRNPTQGLWDETVLSDLFFSNENIQIIQNGIRAGVYYKSNKQYVIGYQDCEPLKIIMRSVYLTHATNQKENITLQIVALNDIVLNYCIRQVYSEAQGYVKYIQDVSTLPVPISHPNQVDVKDKQLELKAWF